VPPSPPPLPENKLKLAILTLYRKALIAAIRDDSLSAYKAVDTSLQDDRVPFLNISISEIANVIVEKMSELNDKSKFPEVLEMMMNNEEYNTMILDIALTHKHQLQNAHIVISLIMSYQT
jgi:hypothetical protein